jgi:hypothetical protein
MSFKPKQTNNSAPRQFEPFVSVFPKAGNRYGRISLIVDMGIQPREDYEDPKTKEVKPQAPAHQVAVFADLVNDVVDYGGAIGKAPYRLLLNKNFKGEVQGINFSMVPPRDADGNLITGKPYAFHPANLLTKIGNAVNLKDVCVDKNKNSGDISLFLNQQALFNVEVNSTEDKNGKKDKDGNVIVYTNVNFKGISSIPEGPDGAIPELAPLSIPAKCITFDDVTKEDVTFIRYGLRQQIKKAENYVGSPMQAAIEAFEAENGGALVQGSQEPTKPAVAPVKAVVKPVTPKKPVASAPADVDDDVPYMQPYYKTVSYVV